MTVRLHEDERGVSIAITHVLTIAITTTLIAGLLVGAGTVLDGEKERSGTQALETIGERVAGEVASVDRLAGNESGDVTLYADHPREVSGSTYTIEVLGSDACSNEDLIEDVDACLRLTSHGGDVTAAVPIANETALDTDSTASGGSIAIEYDGDEISIESDPR